MEGKEEEEEEQKEKNSGVVPFSHFHHFLCIFLFFHLPGDIFFFQSFKSSPLLLILLSISGRWRWLCLCISDIKSTAVPWLLARVNPAHSHLKIK